jgi:hypothetical protein
MGVAARGITITSSTPALPKTILELISENNKGN